ncbi:MAG: hypothetical protein Q4G26_07465, partial [Paracoccus sp. (in: a-proteobacteria)]|nr:hypothetical protein [Paracoccus sp. (in: a-proteobacteria)]
LMIRMILYYIFGALSGLGWLHWDSLANTVTIHLGAAIPALIGAGAHAERLDMKLPPWLRSIIRSAYSTASASVAPCPILER